MKVMIVDDTQLNIDILRKVLAPEGYSIVVESSGEAALRAVPRVKPDLILLDIMMPRIDGLETCRRLKQQDETRDIPVIFTTVKTDADTILEAFQVGGLDYIVKPFRFEEVRARVRTYLHNQTLLRHNARLVKELEMKNQKLQEMTASAPM